MLIRYRVYKDTNSGQWTWHVRTSDGHTFNQSPLYFKTSHEAYNNAKAYRDTAPDIPVTVAP